LCLKAGKELETAAGKKIMLGAERVELRPEPLGGWIRHHGWMLKIDPTAKLVWPVYPFNLYVAAPEAEPKYAVGTLSVPLRLKSKQGHFIRPDKQESAVTRGTD
jgi:hypothetical protein